MKKRYFLMGAWAVCVLCACHNHGHDHADGHGGEDHAHEAEMAAEEAHGGHEDHADEIILTEEKAQAAGVHTETVQPGRFRQVVRTGGQILAAQGEEAAVVAAMPGVVSFARTLAPGMQVERGATLFRLSSDRMEGGDPVERAYIAYRNAKAEYERALPLAQKQIMSQKELQALQSAYEDARVAYEAVAPAQRGKGTAVEAPMGGYVKNVAVGEGDYVNTGQTLATLARNRKLQLRADVPERYYAVLGQIVSARFKTPYDNAVYSVDSLRGRILSYGKSPDAAPFYVPVTFEFDNAGNIIPGAYVDVYLLGRERDSVISLPQPALTEEQGLFFVYVQEDKEVFRKQEVKPGADDGLRVEILSGLKAGDRVVTQGATHVKLASASNAIPAHTHSH